MEIEVGHQDRETAAVTLPGRRAGKILRRRCPKVTCFFVKFLAKEHGRDGPPIVNFRLTAR
jgi:hypothetical protein